MISYKIDKQNLNKVNSEIRNMSALLAEISPTLQTLNEMLTEHDIAINTPSINAFRDELKFLVNESSKLTKRVAENTEKLLAVSDQAGKHLSAIEEHFGATLREKSVETAVAA